jgi:hypothetical protein
MAGGRGPYMACSLGGPRAAQRGRLAQPVRWPIRLSRIFSRRAGGHSSEAS